MSEQFKPPSPELINEEQWSLGLFNRDWNVHLGILPDGVCLDGH